MSNTEAMRAEFEAWAKANGFNINANFCAAEVNQYLATEHAWQGWQAASAGKAEMLEALKRARDFMDTVHDGEYGYSDCTRDEMVAEVDALISRATGEQDTGRESNE